MSPEDRIGGGGHQSPIILARDPNKTGLRPVPPFEGFGRIAQASICGQLTSAKRR